MSRRRQSRAQSRGLRGVAQLYQKQMSERDCWNWDAGATYHITWQGDRIAGLYTDNLESALKNLGRQRDVKVYILDGKSCGRKGQAHEAARSRHKWVFWR